MGNQVTLPQSTTLLTDRSTISFNTSLQSDRSTLSVHKSTKNIKVNSLEELNFHKDIFDFRLKNREYLTYCYGFQLIDTGEKKLFNDFSCKANFLSIKIVFHFQQITQKFSDLYQVPINEGLKLLSHCIKGFSLLYDKFGYFNPEPQTINKQGNQWKVWINENIFVMRTKFTEKKSNSQFSKQRFLQKIVHLFDVLRDQENADFCYTDYIYESKNPSGLPFLSLSQILQRINKNFNMENNLKSNNKISLKRLSVNSSSTVRKLECNNTFVSFDDKNIGDATLSKFGHNKDSFNKIARKSLSLHQDYNQRTKQSHHQNLTQQSHSRHSYFKKPQKQNYFYESQSKLSCSNSKLDNNGFKRVSSKLINETVPNTIEKPCIKEIDKNKHLKGRSSVSTPSNCTGWTKNITPIKNYVLKAEQNACNCACKFRKKQRSLTVELSSNSNSMQQNQCYQPRKITQNSERNSESEENEVKHNDFKDAFLQSQLNILYTGQSEQKQEHIQIISKNPTSNTPSIANKTKNCGQKTMKFLKQYLQYYSKGQHKRSLTDNIGIQNANKVKYCWSQEFDSQFFSNQSYKEQGIRSNLQINEEKEEDQSSAQRQQQVLIEQIEQKKPKKVHIADFPQENEYSYAKNSDEVKQLSQKQSGMGSQTSHNVSLYKLPIFKSQGGLKSLLTNKLSTLKSIKQIQIDIPIDEQILNDLNKIYTKHRFAKSTKLA